MALEVRYVHNVNLQQWVTYNINEVNIVENGFLNEFKLAQGQLAGQHRGVMRPGAARSLGPQQ